MFEKGYIPYFYVADKSDILLNKKLVDKYTEYVKNNSDEFLLYKAQLILESNKNDKCKFFLQFVFVKIDFYKYIKVNEYNGIQFPYFDINIYKISKIKEIIESENTSDKKLLKINEILNFNDNTVLVLPL